MRPPLTRRSLAREAQRSNLAQPVLRTEPHGRRLEDSMRLGLQHANLPPVSFYSRNSVCPHPNSNRTLLVVLGDGKVVIQAIHALVIEVGQDPPKRMKMVTGTRRPSRRVSKGRGKRGEGGCGGVLMTKETEDAGCSHRYRARYLADRQWGHSSVLFICASSGKGQKQSSRRALSRAWPSSPASSGV